MGTIGSVGVTILRGSPVPTRQRVEIWTVAGLDGYGSMTLGKADAEFELQAIFWTAGISYANAVFNALIAIQGTIVSIVDDFGQSYPNALIQHVGEPIKTPMIWGVYPAAVRLEVRIKCLTSV